MQRKSLLKSVSNARELGGYRIGEKTVRHNALIRTASLTGISEKDTASLRNRFHADAVIDLRMSLEREAMPDPEIGGAENFFLPVVEPEDLGDYNEEMMKAILLPGEGRMQLMKTAADLGLLDDDLYVRFLTGERGIAAYRKMFEILLNIPEEKAFIWHCTNGKDRTGAASMLILSALGADEEMIMKDYMLTNLYHKKKLLSVRKAVDSFPFDQKTKECMLFSAGAVFDYYMKNALDALSVRYGSVDGYLSEELHVGKEEKEELKRKYLE